jgi:methionine-rich copper-binding protein CopC
MSPLNNIGRFTAVLIWLLLVMVCASAQAPVPDPTPKPATSGISLAPARLELEMQPGSEITVVVNLDYHSTAENSQPVRIVASLNDWTIDRDGQVKFERANTLPNSASPWLIYSPAETTVTPGNLHAIRVTVSVPKDATPGDHLTALIVEQRPDNIKLNENRRQMVIRYRMAAAFYIKVPQLRRQASLESLRAESKDDQIVVTPLLKNTGNSVVRPLTSLKVTDSSGVSVAELPQKESLPLLGGAELVQPLVVESRLAPGTYTVKYRVDFQDGSRPTEGVTELMIPALQRTSNGPTTRAVAPVSNE